MIYWFIDQAIKCSMKHRLYLAIFETNLHSIQTEKVFFFNSL